MKYKGHVHGLVRPNVLHADRDSIKSIPGIWVFHGALFKLSHSFLLFEKGNTDIFLQDSFFL